MPKTVYTHYHKLVRDLIPGIITKDNKTAVFKRIEDDEEYSKFLKEKLQEEVAEYLQDENIGELADILEVLYALCYVQGYTLDELFAVRKTKEMDRGAFFDRILLETVISEEPD